MSAAIADDAQWGSLAADYDETKISPLPYNPVGEVQHFAADAPGRAGEKRKRQAMKEEKTGDDTDDDPETDEIETDESASAEGDEEEVEDEPPAKKQKVSAEKQHQSRQPADASFYAYFYVSDEKNNKPLVEAKKPIRLPGSCRSSYAEFMRELGECIHKSDTLPDWKFEGHDKLQKQVAYVMQNLELHVGNGKGAVSKDPMGVWPTMKKDGTFTKPPRISTHIHVFHKAGAGDSASRYLRTFDEFKEVMPDQVRSLTSKGSAAKAKTKDSTKAKKSSKPKALTARELLSESTRQYKKIKHEQAKQVEALRSVAGGIDGLFVRLSTLEKMHATMADDFRIIKDQNQRLLVLCASAMGLGVQEAVPVEMAL